MTPTRSSTEDLTVALLAACEQGDHRAARHLLRTGADPNPRVPLPISLFERIPLNVAISGNHPRLVALLLSHGANCDNGFTSALGVACQKGKTRIVRLLLRLGADPNGSVYAKEACRWTITPLVVALAECENGCVRALLENGADPNGICEDFSYKHIPTERCTPLLLAAVTGNERAKRLLLVHGADPVLANRLGLSEQSFRPIRNMRARFFCPCRHATRLIREGKETAVIQEALRRVPDLNADGGELLIEACVHRRVDVIQLLLELGADPNKVWQLSLVEADGGTGAIARLFLKHGYDAMAEYRYPLIEACREGHDSLVTLLLDHGVEPDRVPCWGDDCQQCEYTALLQAVLHRNLPSMEALLKKGAHPDLAARGFLRLEDYDHDQEGQWGLPQNSCTPLIVACATGFEKAVERLLEHGASTTLSDGDGRIARDYLSLIKDPELRERVGTLLERHGSASVVQEPLF